VSLNAICIPSNLCRTGTKVHRLASSARSALHQLKTRRNARVHKGLRDAVRLYGAIEWIASHGPKTMLQAPIRQAAQMLDSIL
jgi:hypothetical protein